jgi:hypothetical protein
MTGCDAAERSAKAIAAMLKTCGGCAGSGDFGDVRLDSDLCEALSSAASCGVAVSASIGGGRVTMAIVPVGRDATTSASGDG